MRIQKHRPPSYNPRRNSVLSGFILIWQAFFSGFCVYLSCSEHWQVWLMGQFLLSICMVQWFVIEHDLGHYGFMPNKSACFIFGHLASLFCLLPYCPWEKIHHAHHKWTGWREKDPTIPAITYDQLSKRQIQLINFCWKYWIPIFAVSFSLQTFWNPKNLNRLFPDRISRAKNIFSIVFIAVVMGGLIGYFGGLFFKCWGLAAFLYLSISDPLLLSQHTHLDYQDVATTPLKPVRYVEQPIFCRSVIFPMWVEKYILYHFNKHGLHHQYPWVAFYDLPACASPPENVIGWRDWLKIAKNMPAQDLIFHSTQNTGIKL